MKINMIWIEDSNIPFVFKTPVEYKDFTDALTQTLEYDNGYLDLGINQYNHTREILFPQNIKRLELSVADDEV